MKKIVLFASAALVSGLASCVKEQVNENLSNAAAPGAITVTAVAPGDGTRTTVNALTVNWADGDQILIWDGTTTAAVPTASSAQFSIVSGGSATASFTGTLTGGDVAGTADRTLYATYPVSATTTSSITATGTANGAVAFDLDPVQTQAAGADVDGKYLYMWADPVVIADAVPSATTITLNFQYLCTILDLNITGVPAGEMVTNVTIHGDNGAYTPDANPNTTQNNPQTPFIKRMQIDRTSTIGHLHFGNVGTVTYYINDVGVNITGATAATNVTAHIAVVPRDLMTDKDGYPICTPIPAGGTRDLTVTITTTDGSSNTHTYVFPKKATNTRKWTPGGRITLKVGDLASGGADFNLSDPTYQTVPTALDPADGTIASKQITILTGKGLAWLATNNSVFAGYQGYTVTVANPLDLSGTQPWTPIGNSTMPFTGTFHGASQAISNLVLDNTTAAQGMFGYAGKSGVAATVIDGVTIVPTAAILPAHATVTDVGGQGCGALLGCGFNVNISQCNVTGPGIAAANPVIMYPTTDYTGVLVGQLNNSTLTDCHVTNVKMAQVTGGGAVNHVSFLVGATTNKNNNSGGGAATAGMVNITNCTVENSIYNFATSFGVGGMLGIADNVPVTITNCQFVNSQIISTNSSNSNAADGWGGIVGTISSNGSGTTTSAGSLVTGCSASGTITTGAGPTGGICGALQSASAIKNCTNTAVITALGTNANNGAGGIVGRIGTMTLSTANPPATPVVVKSYPAVVIGCINNANVKGGSGNGAEGICGGICGINAGGLVVGCKQAGGTITATASSNTAPGTADVGGICGLNSGQITACAVTGGVLTTARGAGTTGTLTTVSNIIAREIASGAAETCYYTASVVTASVAGTTTTGGTDLASNLPGSGEAGWGTTEPAGWSATNTVNTIAPYALSIPSMTGWATPWADITVNPPKLTGE